MTKIKSITIELVYEDDTDLNIKCSKSKTTFNSNQFENAKKWLNIKELESLPTYNIFCAYKTRPRKNKAIVEKKYIFIDNQFHPTDHNNMVKITDFKYIYSCVKGKLKPYKEVITESQIPEYQKQYNG